MNNLIKYFKVLGTVLMSCLATLAFSQVATVSFPNNVQVYPYSETPLQVSVAGYSCKETFIKSNNGKIEYVMPCRYYLVADRTGETLIDVFVLKGRDTVLLGRQLLVVKDRPLPEATVAGLRGGPIQKGHLKAQQGVGASYFIAGNHWESCPISSYHVVVTRNDTLVFNKFNQGKFFDPAVISFFPNLLAGDRVAIINIKGCEERGGGDLKSLEFIITE